MQPLGWRRLFGEAQFLGRKPLGLPPSGKVHTCPPSPCSVRGAWVVVASAVENCLEWEGSTWPEPASLPSALTVSMQNRSHKLSGVPSFGGFRYSGQSIRDHFFVWQQREAGKLLPSRPPKQLQSTQTSSAYFYGCHCWVQGMGKSTCEPFQLVAEPTDSHNSNCDGIFKLCPNDGVSCCVNREARKFADAMWSGTAPPALVCG
eukprot:1156806-Pelagomonas_calceolata.AAC.9